MISHKNIIQQRTVPTILTLHKAEFARFAFSFGDSCKERIHPAKRHADALGVIVLLKEYQTVLTDGNDLYVNLTGNPGVAFSGSGDVLSGIITSILGQKIESIDGNCM